MLDIYFEPAYGKLYEKIEHGESTIYEYKSNIGNVYHMFIKREIEELVEGKKWYDLITPYGYGGPILKDCKKENKHLLIEEFYEDFSQYCKENNIVSEFIRFHPIINNAIDFKDIYEVSRIRKTIGTNLKDHKDPFEKEFSKSCRKNIRRALRNGVSYRVIERPQDIRGFKTFYFSTMDRNEALDYYYFDDDYFNQCIETLGENVILVEAIYNDKPIAMGFYLVYGKTIHIHLSGTLSKYLYLSPAYILRYGVTIWGKENGYELIHHGGGKSNSENDPLYTFKKRFGSIEFDFYIGKKIWNKKIYNKLITGKPQSEFFPLYRSRD